MAARQTDLYHRPEAMTEDDNDSIGTNTARFFRRVRDDHGVEAVVAITTDMIITCAAIMAREMGPTYARAVLRAAADVLPVERGKSAEILDFPPRHNPKQRGQYDRRR
jgi:hypothetical protein